MWERFKKWYFAWGPRIRYGTHPEAIEVEKCEEHTCLNCGTEFRGEFCPGCGQRGNVGRLTFLGAIDNLLGVFASMDKGLVHTCTDLFYRPGFMMRDYVKGHRVEYIRPIQLLFLLSTVYLFIHYVLYQHAEADAFVLTDSEGNPLVLPGLAGVCVSLVNAMLSNRAVLALISVAIFLLPMWLAFRKTEIGRDTSLTEFFFVMVYVACQQMLFNILNLPLDYLMGAEGSNGVGMSLLLMIWSFHQYFDVSWKSCALHCVIGSFLLSIPLIVVLAFVNMYNHFGWTFLW